MHRVLNMHTMKRINASIPDDYADKAQQLATQERRSLSSWVALLVIDAVDESEAK